MENKINIKKNCLFSSKITLHSGGVLAPMCSLYYTPQIVDLEQFHHQGCLLGTKLPIES